MVRYPPSRALPFLSFLTPRSLLLFSFFLFFPRSARSFCCCVLLLLLCRRRPLHTLRRGCERLFFPLLLFLSMGACICHPCRHNTIIHRRHHHHSCTTTHAGAHRASNAHLPPPHPSPGHAHTHFFFVVVCVCLLCARPGRSFPLLASPFTMPYNTACAHAVLRTTLPPLPFSPPHYAPQVKKSENSKKQK